MTEELVFASIASHRRPHVFTVGNEKGGTGKSTTAMHLAAALLELGFDVGTIDLDIRQETLTHYTKNRQAFIERTSASLKMPHHAIVEPTGDDLIGAGIYAFSTLSDCDFVVVDTPGSDTPLGRLGHLNADTLITPLNDSLLDIDVIAELDPLRRVVRAPSPYTQMVWEQSNRRVIAGLKPIDWVVMRNRLGYLQSWNQREISDLLKQLARRIGFRLTQGLGERVIFRELFLQGLTLFDSIYTRDRDRRLRPPESAYKELSAFLGSLGLQGELPVGTRRTVSVSCA